MRLVGEVPHLQRVRLVLGRDRGSSPQSLGPSVRSKACQVSGSIERAPQPYSTMNQALSERLSSAKAATNVA
jgi:hypothetical protein